MDTKEKTNLEDLFKAGMHFAYSRSRRHPTALPYIFGNKNRTEIFDLDKVSDKLSEAREFVRTLAAMGKQVLFVSGKQEGKEVLKSYAESCGQPYVAGRFIGGSLTNFPQIRKRVERLEKLLAEKTAGELGKYTKKERLLIDREIERLDHDFGGIVSMKSIPSAVIVVDPKREHIAVSEANKLSIPVIALANSDCNISGIQFPVPGNDSLKSSIELFVKEISLGYKDGRKGVAPAITAE